MLHPSDTHLTGDQSSPQKNLPDEPLHLAEGQQALYQHAAGSLNRFSPSETPHSDSGFSMSSNSSGEIVGTPFDLGSQRFEYPFPQTQGSPIEPFLPLSSSITSPSHAQLPPWPTHINKSFPLTQPPLSRVKAHPKLRSASAREPPVPPGLAKKRSHFSQGLNRQSSEEQSDRSDASEGVPRGRSRTRASLSFTNADLRRSFQSDASHGSTETVLVRQTASRTRRSLERSAAEDPPAKTVDTGQTEGNSSSPAVSSSTYNV
ncbi:hypothetical protein HYDPIDRAFT_114014 [Hydnomerulius pinastri MD-312]|uniref:Uncharacterized protein n=1 Tax=Hydnomerulius pinastri MD-312 TaxID=994086 RepID=A0A0C9VXB9_9AGAM|nr:hypothetical protein HYDPIDRAFT_114014 [Hydnomerulius pinastri MD-312]